ncbi:hypothetical protein [Sphingobium sp.]|uniref:hypothetical protein n=1 Tax=Sphingobium sp. TaxID=1912891 RepID=UPI003BB7FF6E
MKQINERAGLLAQVERNKALAEDMLRQAHLVSPDAAEQIGAMMTAATVLIEREVGRLAAPGLLVALIGPTLAEWQAGDQPRPH